MKPAIPELVLIPDGDDNTDYSTVRAVGIAFAHAGIHLSDIGEHTGQPVMAFPAIVCSSFAIELLLKFFIKVDRADQALPPQKRIEGHQLDVLWRRLSPAHQALVVSRFGNPQGIPVKDVKPAHVKQFVDALQRVGRQPFVTWRYPHEIEAVAFMSHVGVSEVVSALGHAADQVMRDKNAAGYDQPFEPVDINASPNSSQDRSAELTRPPLTDSDGVPLLNGSEPILLDLPSPLREVPVTVAYHFSELLDAIRFNVEFMDIAYARLRNELTQVALDPPPGDQISSMSARLLHDAWSYVDALARFENAYKRLVTRPADPTPTVPPLEGVCAPFHALLELRGKGLPLAETGESAPERVFTELSWMTAVKLRPQVVAWRCVLRAGTLYEEPEPPKEPVLTTLDFPTDAVVLSIGETRANLSTSRRHIALRIRHLEEQITQLFSQEPHSRVFTASDSLTRRSFVQDPRL
ncbi:MAG: hypothetical protein H7274_16085 [Rhodoferax sp.]|nr:hypothetical protein [Rhodoferax sp.]